MHVQHDGLRVLSAEVQELRSALRRLAAHVMWHNAAVVGSQKEPVVERSSARTSGTTPSSVDQATNGVQRVTSPQKATSNMKHSGGVDDSDDEEWYSDDEDEPAGEARPLELSAGVTAVAKSAGEARLPGIAEHSVSTEPELAESSDETGLSWSRAGGTTVQPALVQLGLPGPEQRARPVPTLQQP